MATTRGYWIEAPGRGGIRPTPLLPVGGSAVRLQAEFLGISPGTERLVGGGGVPASCDRTMAVPGMQGSFALPLLYGYSFVGVVTEGERKGQRAFAMMPHQEHALVPSADCRWLPTAVPSWRATLFPNLERRPRR
jgi:hypothetical protein